MRPVALLLCSLFFVLVNAAAAPAAQAAGARLDSGEGAVVRAVNGIRARHGLPRLSPSRGLARAASYHSWEMLAADYFAHPSRNGGSFASRVRRYARYRQVGETIAMVSRCGHAGARLVVRMWMRSASHRAILLSSSFRRIGVGQRSGRLGSSRACVVTADLASRR